MTSDRILIVDGLNAFIRSWTVVPQMDINGNHVGGIVGFIRSLKAIMRDVKPSRVIIAWDGKGGSQKRRSVYAEYKAGRKPRTNREYDFGETPEQSQINLKSQYSKLRHYIDSLGITQIDIDDIEADDVIGYLCCHIWPSIDKVIMSTDRDFLQLVDNHTLVYSPTKKLFYTASVIRETFNVLPENFIYMKALIGDTSDNIKGFKGIGEKTVVKLFPFFSDRQTDANEIIEYAKNNINKNKKYRDIAEGRDVFIGNIQLMQLTTPNISSQSIRKIKYAVDKSLNTPVMSAFKLALLRDGIQITDVDLFQVLEEYRIRSMRGSI